MSNDQLDKIAQFEDRMSVVGRDNPDLAAASRKVHNMLTNARHVAESVFNDEVASQPEVVMSISAAIADEIDTIMDERDRKEGGEFDDDEDGEHD